MHYGCQGVVEGITFYSVYPYQYVSPVWVVSTTIVINMQLVKEAGLDEH